METVKLLIPVIKIILILLAISVIGGLVYYFAFPYVFPRVLNRPVNITVWGVVDDEGIMNNIISGYKKQHPNVNVTYAKQTLENYRTRIQAQVNVGQGGDILAIHSTWVPMFLQTKTISQAPTAVISKDEFEKVFYPVAKQTMTQGNNIYALPTQIDGLILYYNKDILAAQGLEVPTTWDSLVSIAAKTAVIEQVGNVTLAGLLKTAGAPLGGYDNFPYWSQTVGLLFMQQPDVSILAPSNDSGKEVVSFYNSPTGSLASGGSAKKIWDPQFTEAVQGFIDGNVTFLFAPASVVVEIKQKNPKLNFGTAVMPQLPAKTVNFSCFWGYGVSSKAQNQEEAWKFVKFLTDAETQKYRFEQETQKFGGSLPYSRVDMAGQLENDPVMGPVVKEAPSFRSFPLCSGTKDNGLNDDMINAFGKAMKASDISKLQPDIQQILNQYNAASFQIP